MKTQFEQGVYEDISQKEWLVTNGIGGYASSSICFTNTRRYHGLLVASFNPPTERRVLVSKIEDFVSMGKDKIPLTSIQHPGLISPEGYKYLNKFERKIKPKAVFEKGSIKIEKSVWMLPNSNTTVIEYINLSAKTVSLELNPLFVDRDFHSTFHQSGDFDYAYAKKGSYLEIKSHQNAKLLYMSFAKAKFTENRYWYNNIEYLEELKRGFDAIEDAYHLGSVTIKLKPKEVYYLVFTTDKKVAVQEAKELEKSYLKQHKRETNKDVNNVFYQDLIRAGNQFVVKRDSTNSYTILAGYHWFSDWGRDTMITMRGLCIAMGKQEESKSILQTFLATLSEGMIPNRFADYKEEEPEYNTVDATLWLFVALYDYYNAFKDKVFIESAFDALTDIIEHHIKGTRYDIHLTENGLLWAGNKETQLTWMDARIDDYSVTPRYGCPVEINALWYNALCIHQFFAKALKKNTSQYQNIINDIEKSFVPQFWNEKGYLNDVIHPTGWKDESIRCNQVYAVSLPFTLLTQGQAEIVMKTVKEKLFTPLGLRTLDTDNHRFKPVYQGNSWDRDTAYHEGTVWAFPLGDYFIAQLKLSSTKQEVIKEFKQVLKSFENHFYHDRAVHGISEIFDGLEPNIGKGCVNQAWSVSALLHVLAVSGLLYDSNEK